MTEPTSHVEREVQRKIAAARIKIQAAKERRDDLAAARKRGLAHRHAAKLRHLAEASRVDTATTADHDQADGQQDDDGPEAA